MGGAVGTIAIAVALLGAFAGGVCAWRVFEGWRRSRRHKASLEGASGVKASRKRSHDMAGVVYGRVISCMERLTRERAMSGKSALKRFAKKGAEDTKALFAGKQDVSRQLELAGLDGRVGVDAFYESRRRFAAVFAAVGLAVGIVLSGQLALVLAVVGAFLGWRMPGQAIKTMTRVRANETERHLPEMLDVVALGMRSGLSFDASVRIYARHFDTVLAHELENSCVQWGSGLVRRDEALRRLASTYDSVVFGRVVETVIRSIRHGSSMVASLEADAAEARSICQSQREERIAKAPVKMMIPTGVLILPAMLIMVLGPVLLELAGGGI